MNNDSQQKMSLIEKPASGISILAIVFVSLFAISIFSINPDDIIEVKTLKVIVSFLLPLSALGVTLSFGIFKRRSEKYQFISILVYSFVMSLTVIASAAILRWDHGDVFEKTLSDSLTSFCIVTIALIGGLIYLDKHYMLSRKK